MSLECGECREAIFCDTPLYAVTYKGASATVALCAICCDAIPETERHPAKEISDSGLTVCEGMSPRNGLFPTYSFIYFRRGQSQFRISTRIAVK
ncbi:MAG: hypothetical protein AAB692_02480, partial [Patescibacteria group bacterium]